MEMSRNSFSNLLHNMLPLAHLHVLHHLHTRLKTCRAPWVITGSMGMVLQGMELEVHDIDLQTDELGAYEIERHLSEYVTMPVHDRPSERIRSHFGQLLVEGIQVEIMGALQKRLPDDTWEPPVHVEDHRQWVEIEGMILPVLSLTYEYQAYLNLNRPEKAARILAHLHA